MTYKEFLEQKIDVAPLSGLDVDESELNLVLKPHQRVSVLWALKGGRRALFARFGLGKTAMQLEWCRLVQKHAGGKALIVLPLNVKREFVDDAENLLHMTPPVYVRNMAEADAADAPILMTNYERVRDGDIDPRRFTAVSLDEAATLRSFGSKTYQVFLDKFKGVRYKLVNTATPSPNRYKELIHYAGFLEIMDTGQALTRFFKRDSTKANNLTLYPGREREFWIWCASWGLFLQKPSDLGFSDEGYSLPPLDIRYHRLDTDLADAGCDKDGQLKLARDAAFGLRDAAREKRESIAARVAEAKRIIDSDPGAHFVIWHDLEDERKAIQADIPEAVEIYGTMDVEEREKRVEDFAYGRTRLFATKKSLSGSGCNFQRYCHRAVFLGIDYEFNDFIQAIHRIYRFLQAEPVIIDIIYMDSESEILRALKQKWKQYDELTETMEQLIRTYGLGTAALETLKRTIGVERVEVTGNQYKAINNDCVEELKTWPDNSVDMILTSIPFGNHYEYSPSYNDFGHNPDDEAFFQQMDYLTPNLLRVLRPGRVAAIHVKDRILFGNATGLGMPSVEPFHADTIQHFMRHGFVFFGMVTIVTDVVRENNQTYRLGWTEQCKDGSKMGVGCPEYLLLFRKLPTDTTKAYADVPVKKRKEDYTRAQWQIDAHAFWRSSGDRLVTKAEVEAAPVDKLQAVYRRYSRDHVYSYDEHVALAKKLDQEGRLPATFMVCAPGSWSDGVWDDINRMRTLNTSQRLKKRELHVCLVRGSLILTRDGYKPIEDVKIGDMVLTHQGRWKPVIAKRCTGVNRVIQTKAQGVPHLVTTPDHKLWARVTDKSRKKDYMRKTEPAWVEAKDCPGGYVNLKLPPVEENDLTLQEWWIVGRYLADGHIGTRGDFFISVGSKKIPEFESMAHGFFGSFADRSARQYRLKNLSEPCKKMLKKCGHGAENKQVPIEGMCANKEQSEYLLRGYLSGDGNKTGNAISAASVSRALLLGMAMVAQRARGVIASVSPGKPEGTAVIEGRTVKTKQEWVMSWRESKHHHESEMLEDGAWKKVRTPIERGNMETWSIQVADDASYTAEGCIVKNCPLQLDIVERAINRWSNPGDTILDPFGGLMTVPYMAVKMQRYGVGIELSCDYFRDGLGYLQEADEAGKAFTLFDLAGEVG